MVGPIGEHLLEPAGSRKRDRKIAQGVQLRVSVPAGEQKVHPGILIPHRRGEEGGRREMCIFSVGWKSCCS